MKHIYRTLLLTLVLMASQHTLAQVFDTTEVPMLKKARVKSRTVYTQSDLDLKNGLLGMAIQRQFFDSNGRLIEEQSLSADTASYRTVYQRNARGQVEKTIYYTGSSYVRGVYTLLYNSLGQETGNFHVQENRPVYHDTKQYDAKGRLVEEQRFYPDSSRQHLIKYKYNAQGKVEQQLTLRGNRKDTVGIYSFKYDSKGRTVEEIYLFSHSLSSKRYTYKPDGSLEIKYESTNNGGSASQEYKTFNALGQLHTRRYVVSGKGNDYFYENLYNDKNLLVTTISKQQGSAGRKTVLNYNKQGLLESQNSYYKDTLYSSEKYWYDANERLTRRWFRYMQEKDFRQQVDYTYDAKGQCVSQMVVKPAALQADIFSYGQKPRYVKKSDYDTTYIIFDGAQTYHQRLLNEEPFVLSCTQTLGRTDIGIDWGPHCGIYLLSKSTISQSPRKQRERLSLSNYRDTLELTRETELDAKGQWTSILDTDAQGIMRAHYERLPSGQYRFTELFSQRTSKPGIDSVQFYMDYNGTHHEVWHINTAGDTTQHTVRYAGGNSENDYYTYAAGRKIKEWHDWGSPKLMHHENHFEYNSEGQITMIYRYGHNGAMSAKEQYTYKNGRLVLIENIAPTPETRQLYLYEYYD
jgi:hypothetical protein